MRKVPLISYTGSNVSQLVGVLSMQMPWEQINKYLLSCGKVHKPYDFCVAAFEGLHQFVDFDQGLFFMLDGNSRVTRKHFWNVPKQWSSMYLEYFAHVGSREFSLDGLPSELPETTFVTVVDWDIYENVHTDFLDYYIRRRGLRSTISFVLFDMRGLPATLFCFDRINDRRKYSEEDIELVSLIAEHLNNTFKNMFLGSAGAVSAIDEVDGSERLTEREREIVDMLCQGVRPANIAKALFISINTVNKHVSNIYRKLGVNSRQELMARLLH